MRVFGREPMTEPYAGEALVAEQHCHALPSVLADDDDLEVIADVVDERATLPSRPRWLIWPLENPAAAEEAIDAGALSFQFFRARSGWRHGTMVSTP